MEKFYKKVSLLLLLILALFIFAGCGGSEKPDIPTLNGEKWVSLDKEVQTSVVEELIKESGDKGADHTAKYFVRQLNTFFGNPGMSSKLVKDVFSQLVATNKTADELAIVDGYAWKKMNTEEKISVLKAEVKDISDKNPAFKPKSIEEYLREMNEIYKTEDSRFLKQSINSTMKKVLTNNLIINGEIIK